MKPYVLLVNPAAPIKAVMHMPFALIGLGYLAAVLEKNQFKVEVIDCQVSNLSDENFRKEIQTRKPDIVGFTSSTLTYKAGLRLAKIVKEISPETLTIMGGSHVTFWDENALNECKELDFVIRKEGELTLLELVQRFAAGKPLWDVIGTTTRKNGKIIKNPDRPYIEDLDSLPIPARHLWPMELFRKYEDVLYLITSRGCTFWCEFCTTVRMHGRKFRMRSPKNVADELEYLNKTYQIKKFTFCDDAFTVDQNRTYELCNEILKRNLKIEWNCGTRIDMLTKDLLIKMKEAGCVSVWFGVESGTQEVLDAMKKGITTEQTMKVLGWVRELGLKPVPNVILGFPGETKKSAWKTIKFVEKISPHHIASYNVATPFPGTPLYDLAKEKGWLRVTDFDEYDTTKPVFETPWLSFKDLGKLRESALNHFYLRKEYFWDKKNRFKFSTLVTVGINFLKNLKLKLS